MEYFKIAEAISKDEFIEAYKESINLLQILFSPFGSENVFEILGKAGFYFYLFIIFFMVEN
jgi:hypothetical protein